MSGGQLRDLFHAQDEAFQVFTLGVEKVDGVVWRGMQKVEDLDRAAGVHSCLKENIPKKLGRYVPAARKGKKQAAGW